MLKVACIQLTSSADMLDNITLIEGLVARAAGQGAKLIATPENSFLIENSVEKSNSQKVFYTQNEHPAIKASANMALTHKVWLLIGSVFVSADGVKKNYNRSLLFNPQGEIVGQYDKIHLFDVEVGDGQTYIESAKIIAGNEAVLATTPWGKIGMTVCYDLRFPQLYRMLAKAGANIITVPAAFTEVTGEAHWHVLLRARAIETGCFVIAPAQTGTHAGGRKTYGHSLIINPWGEVIADGGTASGVIIADLDLSEVEKTRAKLPSLQHDREFKLSFPLLNN
jgi:predicted amidohydrolase